MTTFLNFLSVGSTFIVITGIIYFVLNLTLGWIKFLNRTVLNLISIKDLVFYSIAILLQIKYVTFYQPW